LPFFVARRNNQHLWLWAVQQATKIDFVINMKTARSLGIEVTLPLLGRADEVIE
jgi:ABC-type uncharacterized transport system substrate-binding protein